MHPTSLQFHGLPWPVLAVISIAAAVQIVFYSRYLARIRFPRRWRLLTLRSAVYAILIFLAAGPRFDIVGRRPVPMDVDVLVDTSQSMMLTDTPRADSRLAESLQLAQRLAAIPDLRTSYLSVGDETRTQSLQTLKQLDAIDSDSRLLPAVIDEMQKRHAPLAIVLFSDGADKSGAHFPPGLRSAIGKRIPVFSVGSGAPPKPNAGVSSLILPETAYTGKPLSIRGTLLASGLEGTSVSLELTVNNNHARSLAVKAPRDGTGVPFEFTFVPVRAGSLTFSVRARTSVSEATAADNERFAFARALETKKQLLYVDSPRWEYTFLRRFLLARRDIETVFAPLTPRGALSGMAVSRSALSAAALPRFRMVVVGNALPMLRPAEVSALAAYARGGGYLLLLGGNTSMLSANNPVLSACGIRAVPSDDIEGAFFPKPTRAGQSSPLLRIIDNAGNAAAWDTLPYLFTFNPVKADSAETLAEHPWKGSAGRKWPLILNSRPGTGRCIAFAFEGLWRWKLDPRGGDVYDSLFGNMLSEALQREPSEAATLSISRRNVKPGESVCFDVSVRQSARRIQVHVNPHSGGATVNLEAKRLPDSSVFRACSSFRTAGLYDARAEADATTRTPLQSFAVELNEMEFQPAGIEPAFLKEIAVRTGGAYLGNRVSERDILKSIRRNQSTRIERRTVEPWRHAWLFLLIALLPLAEWTIRRREGLT